MVEKMPKAISRDVALFGGSFNPPTYAHKVIGEVVFAETTINEFWYMPCYDHKFDKKSVSATHRLNMVNAMVEQMNPLIDLARRVNPRTTIEQMALDENILGHRFKVCDFEIANETSGSMHETLTALKEQYPGYHFRIVVGSDCANDILEKWHKGEELVRENHFIILTRGLHELKIPWLNTDLHEVLTFGTNGSSTEVRKNIKEGYLPCYSYQKLDPAVAYYIFENKLYQDEEK